MLKKFKNTSLLFSVVFVLIITLTGFTTSTKSTFTIQFENVVGNDILKLDNATYKNSFGQTFTVSKFKYYISNIRLKNISGKEFKSKEYFLVDEENLKSKTLSLKAIPEGEYSSITFTVGVDSLHNCSGVQKGALDPVKGMFWAWNTGYIFMKLEGHSPQSFSQGKLFEFHIGGFEAPNNCIRTVTLPLSKHLKAGKEIASALKVKADILKLFNSKTAIDFSKMSSVTAKHNATTVADNYALMFSVSEIK